jgi:hypothetical protein
MCKSFFIVFVFLCVKSYGQNTTEEEFNWMNKGYKVMITSGLDMKKGYYFEDSQGFSSISGNYEIEYKFLKREKDNSLAGILIAAKSSINGNVNYYGMPIGEFYPRKTELIGSDSAITFEMYDESEFMSPFLLSINSTDYNLKMSIMHSMIRLIAQNSMLYLPKSPNKK